MFNYDILFSEKSIFTVFQLYLKTEITAYPKFPAPPITNIDF